MHQRSAESVEYVYHAVPQNMSGEILYPLNMLRNIHSEAYEHAAKKYEWRRNFLNLTIPRIECRWNDVLHFTIIHPQEIFTELKSAGYISKGSLLFYEVPIASVSGLPHAIYFTPPPVLDEQTYTSEQQAPPHIIDPERVKLPSEVDLRRSPFPQSTREYFKFELDHGRIPLAFNGLPHFLLRAPLAIGGFRTIDWRVSD